MKRTALLVALVAMTLTAVSFRPAVAEEKVPKYVFVFIGDGTSIPQRTSAEYYRANQAQPRDWTPQILRAQGKMSKNTGISDMVPNYSRLVMNTFPAQGLSTTYSYNSLITDSSSSGTAIATGRKTRDGVVGMDPEGKERYVSMAKMAKAKGKKVGVISSVSLDHATPASFYACQPHRNSYYEISLQTIESGFDFFGGGAFKQPRGAKGDQKDVYEAMKAAGYTIATDRAGYLALKPGMGKVLTINPDRDADEALPFAIDRKQGDMSLADFVAKGIEMLDNPNGFFLMTEGGKIDWACHANDAMAAIGDVIAYDDAVAVAYNFYKQHPDETLIVVTGDHETGGMTVGFAGTRYDTFFDRITNQKGSYITFTKVVGDLKKQFPQATIQDIMPTLEQFYGVKLYADNELADLKSKAASGDVAAVEALQYALQPWEVDVIQKALTMSWVPQENRPRNEDYYYKDYGSYEPLQVAMTHVLNNKAGIGWTSFSHTGLPTPVSAIGVGYEKFMGHFDNTDIFHKVVDIARY